MHKKKIIFFPAEAGIAHITRSLAIAEALLNRGHQILFALHPSKYPLIKSTKVPLHPNTLFLEDSHVPVFNSLNTPDFYTPHIKADQKLIDSFKPDIVVADFRLPSLVAAFARQLPTYWISGSAALPQGCYIPNPGYHRLAHRLLTPIFQRIVARTKFNFLKPLCQSASQLGISTSPKQIFSFPTWIVPEPAHYLPTINSPQPTHFVGPIFWDGFECPAPRWLPQITKSKRSVYLTFGGTGFDRRKLTSLTKLLLDQNFTVVVSYSNIASASDFPDHPNLFVDQYLPGFKIAKKVDLVICHGGFGTITQAIFSGTPVVSIPFNIDQIFHSLRLRELGLGESVLKFNLKHSLTLNFQALQRSGENVTPEEIVTTTTQVLSNLPDYRRRISHFIKPIDCRLSPLTAAKIIESTTHP